jgi:hypothetical protein
MAEKSRRDIESMVDSFYNDLRNLPKAENTEKGRYYIMKSGSNRDESYFELGVRPLTFKPIRRYEDFEEIISKYYETGLETTAMTERNPHFISKVYNNFFRSRIMIKTATKELHIWIPKLSWLFGNRIKIKYRNRYVTGNGFTMS